MVHQTRELNPTTLPGWVHDSGVRVEHDVEVAHLVVARRPVVGQTDYHREKKTLAQASENF